MKIEAELLRHMWPRAPQAKINTISSISERVFEEHGIDDARVVVQLMANISHENGAGTIVRENGNYSSARIVEIFGPGKSSAKVTAAEAQALAHNGPALFDRVYNLPGSPKLAKELGNHLPGDGFKFRGAGDLQATGRGNMERLAKLVGRPEIAENPDLLADPEISFEVAVAEFVALKCVGPAKQGQTERVRRLVNGGTNGMHEVAVWVARWSAAMPDVENPIDVPRGADTGNKTLLNSKIMKGVISTAVPTVIGGASKIAENANSETSHVNLADVSDKIQQASDTITTVQVAADNATAIVHTVKPFLGVPPNMWAAIAIGMGILALGTLAYTGWQRWTKLRDQGV